MANPDERRAAERLPVNAGTTCTLAAQLSEELTPARVRDVSMAGVGLVVMRRVEVGARLAVGLSNPERGFARTVVVRVVHVTTIPGGFLVGGTFDPPLTYQELTALVL